MIALSHNCDTPIRLHARHAARPTFAHDQSALRITGEAISVIRGLLEHGDPLLWRPFPPPIPAHLTEQEVASFLPPYRPFTNSVATAQLLYFLVEGHDAFQLWRDLLYRHSNLLGFCQLVEAHSATRQRGTLPRSSRSLRQPAPCPLSRPNSQIGFASLG